MNTLLNYFTPWIKGLSSHDSFPSMTILRHKYTYTINSHNCSRKGKESQHEECHTISLLSHFVLCKDELQGQSSPKQASLQNLGKKNPS